jgi:hypothetical protein
MAGAGRVDAGGTDESVQAGRASQEEEAKGGGIGRRKGETKRKQAEQAADQALEVRPPAVEPGQRLNAQLPLGPSGPER